MEPTYEQLKKAYDNAYRALKDMSGKTCSSVASITEYEEMFGPRLQRTGTVIGDKFLYDGQDYVRIWNKWYISINCELRPLSVVSSVTLKHIEQAYAEICNP